MPDDAYYRYDAEPVVNSDFERGWIVVLVSGATNEIVRKRFHDCYYGELAELRARALADLLNEELQAAERT